MEKKRGSNKSKAGYTPTKDYVKDNKNNYGNVNKAMDNADPDSKDPSRTERYLM